MLPTRVLMWALPPPSVSPLVIPCTVVVGTSHGVVGSVACSGAVNADAAAARFNAGVANVVDAVVWFQLPTAGCAVVGYAAPPGVDDAENNFSECDNDVCAVVEEGGVSDTVTADGFVQFILIQRNEWVTADKERDVLDDLIDSDRDIPINAIDKAQDSDVKPGVDSDSVLPHHVPSVWRGINLRSGCLSLSLFLVPLDGLLFSIHSHRKKRGRVKIGLWSFIQKSMSRRGKGCKGGKGGKGLYKGGDKCH